jgi:hypothetical protein
MRRLFLITTVVMLVGGGTSFAQVGLTSSPAAPPAGAPVGAPAGVTVSAPPAGSPGSALGAIRLNLAAPIAGIGVGTITACPASGATGTVSGPPIDPSDPMASDMATASTAPATASLPLSPTDPLATENSQFGTSALSGNCSPPSAPPSPAAVDTSTFGDGAVPLSATEGGSSGLSPLIAVPPPGCQNSLMTPEMATLPMPYDSNGATGGFSSSTC